MARRKYRHIKRDVKPPTKKPLAGLTRYECPNHGFIADAVTGEDTVAWCPCGRIGKATAQGPERKQ